MKYSITLAVFGGILVPVLETIRRWHQIPHPEYFLFWFDDYIMGTALLFAAWKARTDLRNGPQYLSAAWGMATGMMLLSLFGQLQRIDQIDPAPVSSGMVAVIKGLMLIGCITGLVLSFQNKNAKS